MKQTFKTEELKTELERSLGFALRSLERLDGASALNFKAVRDSDGMAFAVKCSPLSRQKMFDGLVRHLTDLKGTKAVQRLFERDCPAAFRGYNLVCTAWCSGRRMFPDALTDGQMQGFLDDYLTFSAALQRTSHIVPHDPFVTWRAEALAKCRGLGGFVMRRLLQEISVADLDYREELLRIIHGDFHHGNFLFEDGRVSVYLDLEEFCQGYPTEDLLRYFCCAAEHLRWYEQGRKRRMLKLFELAVRHLPYSRHEWLVAINSRFICRVFMNTNGVSRIGLFKTLNLAFRAAFYRKLRAIVRRET